MAEITKREKVTFTLPSSLVRRMKDAVASGEVPSQNALLRQALERELRHLREEWLDKQYEAASKDEEFLREIDETMEAFKHADAETARMIPE